MAKATIRSGSDAPTGLLAPAVAAALGAYGRPGRDVGGDDAVGGDDDVGGDDVGGEVEVGAGDEVVVDDVDEDVEDEVVDAVGRPGANVVVVATVVIGDSDSEVRLVVVGARVPSVPVGVAPSEVVLVGVVPESRAGSAVSLPLTKQPMVRVDQGSRHRRATTRGWHRLGRCAGASCIRNRSMSPKGVRPCPRTAVRSG